MHTFLQDLRFGSRMLLKKPGFTIVAVLTLALGIGVNTAIFSGINTLLLRPSAVDRSEELVNAFAGSEKSLRVWDDFSYPDYRDYRDQAVVFSGLIAHRMTSVALSDGGGGEREHAEIIWGEMVSGNYFDVLGVAPVVGRGFVAEEDREPSSHPVVVLSQALWQRRFGANPAVINQDITLNGHPFTVVGVAPESFQGTKFPLAMDFWVPLMMRSRLAGNDTWRTDRGDQFLTLTGRLKPGATAEQAEAEMNTLLARLGELYPTIHAGEKVQVVPEREGRVSDAFPVLRLISAFAMVIVALVLLVACANVANLLLSRAAARRREIGVRLALGASRWRIVRQLLTESLLLACLGGALGLLVTYWATDLMNAATPPFPYRLDFSFAPDGRVMKWAAAITLLTGFVFGLAPALNAARTDLVPILKGEDGTAGGGRRWRQRWGLRNLLVVAQLAISIVVLVSAGLLLQSLRNLQAADPGFRTENLISMQLDPELLGYTPAEGKRLYAELERRAAALPGVAAATVSQVVPLSDNNYSTGPLILEGQEPPPPNQGLSVSYSSVGTRYFETMETELLSGRDFRESDDDGTPPVVIINQTLARRLFGSEQEALGKRFYLGDKQHPPFEVIGIARDGKYRTLFEDPRNYMFLSYRQRFYWSWAALLVRTRAAGDVGAVVEDLRQEVQKMDARLPVFDIKLGDELLSYAVWGPRLGAWMATSFGVLALVLAATGLYSVMAYAVSRRRREIGIRMALGATPGAVLRLVLRQALALITVGVGAGLSAAFALARLLSGLLYGVRTDDPLVFASIAVLLAGVALVACLVPARRALKVDPMVALRYE